MSSSGSVLKRQSVWVQFLILQNRYVSLELDPLGTGLIWTVYIPTYHGPKKKNLKTISSCRVCKMRQCDKVPSKMSDPSKFYILNYLITQRKNKNLLNLDQMLVLCYFYNDGDQHILVDIKYIVRGFFTLCEKNLQIYPNFKL